MRQQYRSENLDTWLEYYRNQAEQVGYGISGFKGSPYQRGAGLGSFFRSLFRMAVPLLKSSAVHIGKQALTTGANIATDLVHGRPLDESLQDRAKEGVTELVDKASNALRQRGRGLGTRPKVIKGVMNDVFNNSSTKKNPKKRKTNS